MNENEKNKKKCCLCGDEIEIEYSGWADGHNAQPVADGRCCSFCNCAVVIPTRMGLIVRATGVSG